MARYYTDEQKEWLKEVYPKYGSKKTSRMFAEQFGKMVKPETLRRYCRMWLGCSVPKEVHYGRMTSPVGTLSENCRGEVKVKTESGWIKATHLNVDVPDGMVAFNLDGDKFNNSAENIGITTNSIFRSLRNNGFWSNDREITKTGMLWCELERLLKAERKETEDAIH